MIPLAGLGIGAVGGALGPVLSAPARAIGGYIDAKFEPVNAVKRYREWWKKPVILPGPGEVLDALNRELLDPAVADRILRWQGVRASGDPGSDVEGNALRGWEAVREMVRHLPGPDAWVQQYARGWIDQDVLATWITRLGGVPEAWRQTAALHRARPSPEFALRAHWMGLLQREEAKRLALSWGGDDDALFEWEGLLSEVPGTVETLQLLNRERIDVETARRYLARSGMGNRAEQDNILSLARGIPGVSDVLRMISRQLFSPDVVGDYGLYQGYDARADPYFKQLGLSYPLNFQVPTERGLEQATLPMLYWAMTREILSLGQAYQAYQRLRPDQIRRWQNEIPTLRPFTIDDLRFHLRVAGYPPPMQDYQIALSHPPIGVRAIAQASQFLDVPRAWVFNRYLDLGFREDDAALQADLQEARKGYQESATERSIVQSVKRQTVTMIEGLYEDGILDHDAALRQLADAGFPGPVGVQMLDIVDFRVERSLISRAVNAVRRDYLSGELSLDDAGTQLGRIGIAAARQRNYLSAWTIERTGRRRRLETSKILGLVGKGMLPYDDARQRLANLGWADPDAMLLLGEAESSLRDREQRAAKATERDAKARARELERLAKQAEAQAAKLRADANRVAPRGVLYKWLQEAILSEDQFRSMMRERGYPDDLIDDYIRQSKWQKPSGGGGGGGAGGGARRPKERYLSRADLAKMYLDEVISEDQFRAYLALLGYGAEEIDLIVQETNIGGPRGKRKIEGPEEPAQAEE